MKQTEIQKMLFALQNENYANFHSRLMPTIAREKIIGVKNPLVRDLAKTIFKENPTLMENFINTLPHTYYEENNLHIF